MDFQPDQVEFGDIPGYGSFDIGHWREHIGFVQAFAQRTPAILLPDPDLGALLSGGSTTFDTGQTHMVIHGLLRGYLNINGVDYTDFRMDQAPDFYAFLQYHSVEHAQIRQALGLT